MQKRIISILLVLCLTLCLLPAAVWAENSDAQPETPSVSAEEIPAEAEAEELSEKDDENLPPEVTEPEAVEPEEELSPETAESEKEPAEELSVTKEAEDALLLAPPAPLTSEDGLFFYSADASAVTLLGFALEDFPARLELPAEIGGKPVTAIGAEAFAGNAALKRVLIPDTVQSIGRRAFADCPSLLNAEFAGAPPTMGSGVFSGCAKDFAVWVTGDTTRWPFYDFDPEIYYSRTNYWRPTYGDSYACYDKSGNGVSAHTVVTVEGDGIYGEKIIPNVVYSDDYFTGSNASLQYGLAELSLCMSMTAYSYPTRFDTSSRLYNHSDRFIRQSLETAGFENDYYQYRFGDSASTFDEAAYAFAWKLLPDGKTPLVAIFFRGFNYVGEWVSNAHLFEPDDPDHSYGFYHAAQIALNGGGEYSIDRWSEESANLSLRDYLAQNGIDAKSAKFWIAGYSRGAAAANCLGALMSQDEAFSADNLFVYTFACPLTVRESAAFPCPGIFNIYSETDPVAAIPPRKWGFTRYGSSYALPCRALSGANFDTRLAAAKNAFSSLMDSYGTPEVEFLYVDGQELVLDKLLELVLALAPSPEDYRGTLQNTLMDLLRSNYVTGEDVDFYDVVGYLLQNREINSTICSIAEDLRGLGEGRLPDKTAFMTKVNRLVSLTKTTDSLWSIPSVRIGEWIYDFAKSLYADTAKLVRRGDYSALTESAEYKFILLAADLIECAGDGVSANASLLRHHWPEYYLSWLRSGQLGDTLYLNGRAALPAAPVCPVSRAAELITQAVEKAAENVQTMHVLTLTKVSTVVKKAAAVILGAFRR